jgi:hypothetical protein
VLAAAAGGSAAGVSWQEVRQAQLGNPSKTIAFDGRPPPPVGVVVWEQPWIPLLMQWEIEYHPLDAGGDYASSFLTSAFKLDTDGVELIADAPPPEHQGPLQVYRGLAPLSRSIPKALRKQIDAYLKAHAKDAHAGMLNAVAQALDLPMVAQTLAGLHPALAQRTQTLQLPIRDPLAVLDGPLSERFSNGAVPAAVGDQNTLAPIPEGPFNPLRAGYARLGRIWIIDVFGQKRELTPVAKDVIRAQSLIPTGDRSAEPFTGLVPRLLQPSRLLLRFLSADDDNVELNSDPATSPIFGWVLFNRMDDSLAIYDASGTALGSLNMRGPLWSGAPGNAATYLQPVETVFAAANPHLRDFVLGIYSNPDAVGFLGELLAGIDTAAATIEPLGSPQHQALALLVGRPLALVRAKLSLDLRGLPALDQSWEAFATAVNAGSAMEQRANARLPSVQVAVRLGAAADTEDGLVGYFLEGGQDPYRTFYAPAGGGGQHGVRAPAPDTLCVSAAAGDHALVSMLLDPRAAVHAACGVLPAKQIRLAPSLVNPALRSLAVTFLTAPVLSAAARLALPLAKVAAREWSWVSSTPTGWAEEPIPAVDLSAADLSPQRLVEGWLKLNEEPR